MLLPRKVAIYCPRNTLGAFDEDSLAVGVGGSETNAILLARALGDRGHRVLVYNDTEGAKEFGKVIYVNKSTVQTRGSENDVWIVWRNPDGILDLKSFRGRKVLWLHDLVPEMEVLRFSELYDLIWVQSHFHRSYYKNVPDEKFLIAPSGIGYLPPSSKQKREENLLVYTSDYDRGLEVLLDMWPNYKFAFPEDRLVIAYGTQTQEALAKRADESRGDDMGTRSWQYRWEHLIHRMALDGVTHAGKLSKQELADLYERASILAYPSTFPEVQCMSVLEAASHGCIPVTSSMGALQEMNNSGYCLPPDIPFTTNRYLAMLIAARQEITEGRRTASRDLAGTFIWKVLIEDLERRILVA